MSDQDMAQYLVHYRPDAGMDCNARVVTAHRVEGWSEDYAFFGHPKNLEEVTKLIPRDLVSYVEMTYDQFGESVSHSHLKEVPNE